MPPPTLMIPNIKGGGDFTVHKLLNGTTLDPTQDGNTIASTKLSLAGTEEMRNLMLEAFGKRFLVGVGGIRERNQGGDGNWGLVFVPSGSVGQNFTGLHMAFPNGVPTMCWAYQNATGFLYRMVRTTDGVNFTDTLIFDDTAAISYTGRSFVFGDLFFWNVAEFSDTQETLRAFNVANDTYTSWTATGSFGGANIQTNSTPNRDFAVLNDSLYMLVCQVNESRLYRLDGLTWNNVLGGVTPLNADNCGTLARPIMFPDGENLVCFLPGLTGIAARVIHVLDPGSGGSPSTNDITVTVNANALFPTTAEGYAFSKFLDTTTPASPVLYFWAQAGGINGGTYDCYQWNGTGAPITLVGTGVAGANYILPNDIIGGQDRIPATPAARPQFDGLPQQVLGGRRRQFRVYGSGADVTLQQAHSADQQAPSVVSTLVASSIQLVDPIDVTGLVGNASETTLEGLTPATGDAYVLTVLDGDRILNPGGLTGLIPGDIVQYNGSAWVLAKQVVNVDYRLEGYWKFDGDGTDRTAHGRDLTLNGAVPFVAGLFGQATDIPGTAGNYWARTGFDAVFDLGLGDSPFTLSVWLNIDTLPGAQAHIVSKNAAAGAGWELYVDNTGAINFIGLGVSLIGAAAISPGAGWQHIVFVSYGGDSTELYVDGVSVATDSGGWTTTTTPLNVGRDPQTNSNFLDGQVADLAIWSRSLSPAEVTALYNAGSGRELGYPDFGNHAILNSTTALIAPYTDGADDGKTVSFAGRSLSGTVLNTPSNTAAQLTVTPDEGASRWSYLHDTGTDSLPAGTKHTVLLDLV